MTIQIKATEQYFAIVLFIILYKMVLSFESADEIPKCDHSNDIVMLFIMLYKVVLTFGSVNKILTSDHSNEIALSLVVHFQYLNIFQYHNWPALPTYTFCFLGFFLGDAASLLAVVTLASKGAAGADVMLPFITGVVTTLVVGAASLEGSLLILFGDTGAL